MDRHSAIGDMVSGRSTLWMLYQEFEPTGRTYNADTMKDILKLECHPKSLARLQRYLSTLDRLFLRCRSE
eukprot:741996-Heterocapsa_arctica.AAC.1